MEKSKSIKILYAVESGSRAWGFASKDSDYDIRFFYINKPEWYFSIEEKRDTIEFFKDNILDFAGWDFRKTLKLFTKSNPPLLEWLRSPKIYLQRSNVVNKLRKLTAVYFNAESTMYHYLNMAKGNFREYLKGDNVWIKKYFYVLRPVLACEWIKDKNSPPPIEFNDLVELQVKNRALKNEIKKLLEMKIGGNELRYGLKIPVIDEYIKDRFNFFDKYLKNYSLNMTNKTSNSQEVDNLFRSTLKEEWCEY